MVRRFTEFDAPTVEPVAPLATARRGFSGVIVSIQPVEGSGELPPEEIERRLVEMGLVEGASLELVHEGPIGRDPIAVRLADRTVALRRREARAVLVRPHRR